MTDTNGVDVHERAKKLVHVELDLKHGHGLLELCVVTACSVNGLWDVF